MRRFPRRYALYLAATLYLVGDLILGGPVTRGAPNPAARETGPVAARAYGMALPESTLMEAVRHDLQSRGLPPDTPASPGLRIRTINRLLAEGIVTTWVKDEGTYFPGLDPTDREDAWVEQKLAPALIVPDAELETFLKEFPNIPESAALRYLTNRRRPAAARALQREVLRNAAENIAR